MEGGGAKKQVFGGENPLFSFHSIATLPDPHLTINHFPLENEYNFPPLSTRLFALN